MRTTNVKKLFLLVGDSRHEVLPIQCRLQSVVLTENSLRGIYVSVPFDVNQVFLQVIIDNGLSFPCLERVIWINKQPLVHWDLTKKRGPKRRQRLEHTRRREKQTSCGSRRGEKRQGGRTTYTLVGRSSSETEKRKGVNQLENDTYLIVTREIKVFPVNIFVCRIELSNSF